MVMSSYWWPKHMMEDNESHARDAYHHLGGSHRWRSVDPAQLWKGCKRARN